MQHNTRLKELRKELNPREKSIVALERVHKELSAPSSREFATSLISKYRASGFLTDKQWYYVNTLLSQHKKENRSNTSLLYVIECEEFIGIGVSGDVECKLKDVQSTMSEAAKVLYQRDAVYTNKAKTVERKIHRFCREHHIRGEWFTRDALPKVHQFFSKIEKKHKLPPVKQDSV